MNTEKIKKKFNGLSIPTKIALTLGALFIGLCLRHELLAKKIYISGKISGMEEEAKILFAKAEAMLTKKGYDVINPMKLPHDHDKKWSSYLREDLRAMLDYDCEAIYMLKNWHESDGAMLEHINATALKMEIIYESTNSLIA